jgi:hypothetical protein
MRNTDASDRALSVITEKDIDRFWLKVNVSGPDDCWIWLAGKDKVHGYGVFRIKETVVVASRVACFLQKGIAPLPCLFACHTCDNPPCCNGAHLFWGTNRDNLLDAASKGLCGAQVNPERVRRGENHSSAKINEQAVREIRSSKLSTRLLADNFGVSQSAIMLIKQRVNWRHVA